MPGTIIENLSTRKICVLVAVLAVLQLGSFLISSTLEAPPPASTLPITARVCKDKSAGGRIAGVADPIEWFVPNVNCDEVQLDKPQEMSGLIAENLVFAVRMPLSQDFSRWQQNLVGLLQVHVAPFPSQKLSPIVDLTLNASLAYSNRYDTQWRPYARSVEHRIMDCTSAHDSSLGDPNHCSIVPLFELGSLHHDFYLLNVRLPTINGTNAFGHVSELMLILLHMNGGFVKVWMIIKSLFTPLIGGVLFWFWRRVHILDRTPALLEYMLLTLGSALLLLDLPLEMLSLWFEMPFLLLLGDIRQGVFYAVLLSFWLVFAGEHMLIQDNGDRNTLRMYWKHLSAIVIGCAALLVFDLCERGVQLRNPFYSIWVTPIGTNLALSFIILAGISASIYFVMLSYMIWKAFRNISVKRTVLPNMSSARRLHYEGIIYRFNFLMIFTLVCAAVTIISFIMSEFDDNQHKYDDSTQMENYKNLDPTAMYTGVFGLWNVYICAMLILYAPSHKQWPCDPICSDNGEEVAFSQLPESSANEISSLTSFATSFASKSAIE